MIIAINMFMDHHTPLAHVVHKFMEPPLAHVLHKFMDHHTPLVHVLHKFSTPLVHVANVVHNLCFKTF